jgi:integrase
LRKFTRKHGAWYLQVPERLRDRFEGKKWYRLGKTEAEAYRTYFERMGSEASPVNNMEQLFDAWYTQYVMVELAPATQEAYRHYLKPLRLAFGHMLPSRIRPLHAYQYLDSRPRVAGNREVSVLSKTLTFAVRKGLLERNLLRGQVERNAEHPRKRVPSAAELESFLQGSSDTLRHYVALKRITGLRQGQILALKWSDWDGERLRVPAAKGGRDTEYMGPALAVVIGEIERRGAAGRHLFEGRNGRYTRSGFGSLFKRAMAAFVGAGGERFNDHDIRAYVASNAETLEHAQALLGHQDSRTTNRVYRRGAVRVTVLQTIGKPEKPGGESEESKTPVSRGTRENTGGNRET